MFEVELDAAGGESGGDIAHDGEAALGEDIHFNEADGFDRIHIKMGGGVAFMGNEGGGELEDGLAGEDDAAGMHFGVARQAIEELGHFEGGFVRFFLEGEVLVFGAGLEEREEAGAAGRGSGIRHPTAAEAPGKMIGEFADIALGNAEDFGNFRKGAAGLEGGEATDDGAVSGTVFFEEEIDDVIFEVVSEIDIDIRQFVEGHAFLVEEAFEIEIETDGADAADFEAVADEAIRRAAAGDPIDAAAAAFLEEIPGDEKVILVTDLANDGEFFHDLRAMAGGAGTVAVVEALEDEGFEEGAGGGAGRNGISGELGLAEREFEGAAFGNFQGMGEPLGMVAAAEGHFTRGAEVKGNGGAFGGMLLAEQGEGANALDNIVFEAIGRGGVMDGRTGDGMGRRTVAGGQRVKGAGKERGEASIRTDGDEAIGEAAEFIESEGQGLFSGDGGFIEIIFAGMPGVLREERTEVPVAMGGFDIEKERGAVDAEFGAENGFDASSFGGVGKIDGAMEIADIGEGDGGEMVLSGEVDDCLGGKGGIKKGVVTMDAKGNVRDERGGRSADSRGGKGWPAY